MKNYASYIFYESWWVMLSGLDSSTRDEVVCGICKYVFDGIEPVLSPLASGIFMAIRLNIDQSKERYEDRCRKRAEAGRRGGINRAINAGQQLKQSQANQANAYNSKQMQANQAKLSNEYDDEYDNDSSSTIVPEERFIPSTSSSAHARELVHEWLTDNEESLKLNLRDIGVLKQEVSHEELLQIAEPYIQAFIDNIFKGDIDTYMLDRTNVRVHFKAWLPKYNKLITSSNDNSRNKGSQDRAGWPLSEHQYDFS